MRGCFGAAVTGRDVSRGKPDPQVFLLAAERLGVPPARCVVVEDAPPSVLAAHRGGMKAVALLSTGRRREDFDEAKPEARRHLAPRALARDLRAAARYNEP